MQHDTQKTTQNESKAKCLTCLTCIVSSPSSGCQTYVNRVKTGNMLRKRLELCHLP